MGPTTLTIPTFLPDPSNERPVDHIPNWKAKTKAKKLPKPHHSHLELVLGLFIPV